MGVAVYARLPLDDLAVIASAPPTATASELARRLGRPNGTVRDALLRIRRAGGWFCPVRVIACAECGGQLVGPPQRSSHPACALAREAGRAREKRARLTISATPEALAAQRARERARARGYYHRLPVARQAALAARWDATTRRDYQLTREHAEHHRQPWSDADDCYVLDHPNVPAREVGLALGRTSVAVRRRRAVLRRQQARSG